MLLGVQHIKYFKIKSNGLCKVDFDFPILKYFSTKSRKEKCWDQFSQKICKLQQFWSSSFSSGCTVIKFFLFFSFSHVRKLHRPPFTPANIWVFCITFIPLIKKIAGLIKKGPALKAARLDTLTLYPSWNQDELEKLLLPDSLQHPVLTPTRLGMPESEYKGQCEQH